MRTLRETVTLVRGIAKSNDKLADAAQAVLWALPGSRLNRDAERVLLECSPFILTVILDRLVKQRTPGDAMHWMNTQLRDFALKSNMRT